MKPLVKILFFFVLSLLFTTETAGASANAIGGLANREIQGKETTSTDVAVDATLGGGFSLVGHYVGNMTKKYIDSQSTQWKGRLGETITECKYAFKGYKSSGTFEVKTGEFRLNGTDRVARYDHLMTRIGTNEKIIVESKFNSSGLSRNQQLALPNAKYPVIIDRTTSSQISIAFRRLIVGSSGAISSQFNK